MKTQFSLNDIYDKNINFLIGAGASYGLIPTLSLEIKDKAGVKQTIETLATGFYETKENNALYTLLFMHYYKNCIEPVMDMDFGFINLLGDEEEKQEVLDNYKIFIETLLNILQHRKKYDRRCNVFTTNYDGCFEYTADQFLQSGNVAMMEQEGSVLVICKPKILVIM